LSIADFFFFSVYLRLSAVNEVEKTKPIAIVQRSAFSGLRQDK
jgi:hypothetical protein